MKKIKINDIELQIDDGVEIKIDSEGNIKISSCPYLHGTITSTVSKPQTTPIMYFASVNANDKQILNG